MKKVFDKVKRFILAEYKFLIMSFIILFLGLFRLPYNLYVGGGIISLEKRLEVENSYKQEGSLNISYVKSIKATIPAYLLSYLFDWEKESVEEVKIDSKDTAQNMWQREKLYLQEANDNAIISAYKLAGEKINIKQEILKVLYVDQNSETDLEIGDIILSIDGQKIRKFEDIKEIIKDKDIGEKVFVHFMRNDKEKDGYFVVREIDNEKKIGVYIIKLFDYDLDRKVSLNFTNREGGSSAGMMVSLAIYNRLTKFDITKGRKIVGTGTIDSDGNVGPIGGVKYKLAGAVSNKAEIFLVPYENYDEAYKVKEEKGYNIELVKVKTLEEAVEYLKR